MEQFLTSATTKLQIERDMLRRFQTGRQWCHDKLANLDRKEHGGAMGIPDGVRVPRIWRGCE